MNGTRNLVIDYAEYLIPGPEMYHIERLTNPSPLMIIKFLTPYYEECKKNHKTL